MTPPNEENASGVSFCATIVEISVDSKVLRGMFWWAFLVFGFFSLTGFLQDSFISNSYLVGRLIGEHTKSR